MIVFLDRDNRKFLSGILSKGEALHDFKLQSKSEVGPIAIFTYNDFRFVCEAIFNCAFLGNYFYDLRILIKRPARKKRNLRKDLCKIKAK